VTRRQTACKPGSVPPRGAMPGTVMTIPLGRPSPNASCDRPERRREGSPGIFGSLRDACRSYLVLLPVGFSLPPPLPAARCALAAPFHPCRPPGVPRRLAVYFLWHFPWGRPRRALPGTAPPWSPDFPLPAASRRAAIQPSGTRRFGLSRRLCQRLLGFRRSWAGQPRDNQRGFRPDWSPCSSPRPSLASGAREGPATAGG